MSVLLRRGSPLSLLSTLRSLGAHGTARAAVSATAIRLKSTSYQNPLFVSSSNHNFQSKKNRDGNVLRWSRAYSSGLPGHRVIPMPALSPTMEQGNIVNWQKKEGDKIAEGDMLCEIETDKSVMAFESAEEGYLAKILIPSGTKGIALGKPICVIVENEADVTAFANFTAESAGDASSAVSAASPSAAAPAHAPAQTGTLPEHREILLPALSPTMETGKIVKWHKNVGDEIAEGDVLCEIETDKSVMSFEISEEGFLAHVILPEGTAGVPLGKPLCVICTNKDDIAAFANYVPSDGGATSSVAASPTPPTPQPESTATRASVPAFSTSKPQLLGVHATPYAKKLAAEKGVDLSGVKGSGPGGRIIASDVDSAPSRGISALEPSHVTHAPSPLGQAPYVDIPLTNMRATIAKRLLQSKLTVPHYYLFSEIIIDDLLSVREKLNELTVGQGGPKISLNDMVIKATALACERVPATNSFFMGNSIRENKRVDVSVAVSTDEGLITPIIFNAAEKGLSKISSEMKELAQKARQGKLQPAEYQGGTVTISNLGMYSSISEFSAIVNPPQSCIVAVGSAQKKVILDSDDRCKNVTVIRVGLSCDHRVVDGALGAQWLNNFKHFLENPHTMLL